ncbi:hypothetical protein AAFF_G00147590 [Aldrovandia affinis]|uniref:C2H2-type domain-containing protein n=1 Tax=Aldrovandia affinis TaxID=143900 RepID=A0AAD7RPB9_9TELE|nr:hypothetical protein AAFF_G00147590 [Aldrovandia affinis]
MGRHQEAHARVAKQHNCTECGKTFSLPEHLKRHQLLHTGDPSFTCQVCDQRFCDPGWLRSHQRLHPELLMYGCRCYEERFEHAEELHTHEEGAHSAPADASGLSRHLQLHRRQQPHTCHVCDKRFPEHYSFKRHLRMHMMQGPRTNKCPFKCARCGAHLTKTPCQKQVSEDAQLNHTKLFVSCNNM